MDVSGSAASTFAASASATCRTPSTRWRLPMPACRPRRSRQRTHTSLATSAIRRMTRGGSTRIRRTRTGRTALSSRSIPKRAASRSATSPRCTTCGTIINPALVEGQTLGGIAMGAGAALCEEQRYDAGGRLLSDRLKAYLMMRAGDLPAIKLGHQVTPSPYTLSRHQGRRRGLGRGRARIRHQRGGRCARGRFGVELRELPLTPPRILSLLSGKRTSSGGSLARGHPSGAGPLSSFDRSSRRSYGTAPD